jgi:hypothetical protein
MKNMEVEGQKDKPTSVQILSREDRAWAVLLM